MSDHQAPAETRETENVRRYRIDGSHGEYGRWTYHGMERDEAGSWVPYNDHVAALTATRRALADAEAEARLRGETIDALRKELQAEKENNALIAQAANFNAVLAIEELRVEMLGDTLHTAKDGRVRGLCANCLTWHDIGDMWAECRACFDETTGKALREQVETVTRERDEAQQQLKGVATILNNASILNDCATLAGKALRAVSDLTTARAALEDVRKAIGTGCGDTSCRFVRPKGMATNGGCRCVQKPGVVAAFAKAYRALAQEAGDAK